jgi:hypothetical protein
VSPGLRLAVALAAAALLSACATMRVAYDHADLFVRWRANSYLDLTGPQEKELNGRIDRFHDWHRAQALPQYARLAREAGRRMADGLSPDDLIWGYDSVVGQAGESLREAAVQAAPLLDRLDAAQLARIEQRFAEDNRRFAREFLAGTEDEQRNRRAERVVKRLEDWVGVLSEAQIERVRQYAERVPGVEALRDRERKRVQARALEILRAGQAEQRLPRLAAAWRHERDPADAAAGEAVRREFFDMLLELDRTLTESQRAHALTRIHAYAEDFAALAAAGGRADKRVR